jgi:hypothetical protein
LSGVGELATGEPIAGYEGVPWLENASARFEIGQNSTRLVDMPNDLLADSRGVYGYLPKEGSEFHIRRWGGDWTDIDQVAGARTTRLEYHQRLEQKIALIDTLRLDGLTEDDIGRQIVDLRNQDRLSYYETPEALEAVYQRNISKEGYTKYGPSYETQLSKYGTPQAVIDASLRSNPTMDILTGVAKPKR